MSFKVTILGCSSAVPVFNRHHTSQHLTIDNHHFLLDCGEGTQSQLSKYHLKAGRISAIFITHLHGDHFLGLIGLLSTMNLYGRKDPIDVYGPKGLDEIITLQLKYSGSILNYKATFHTVDTTIPQVIFQNERIHVTTIPLSHRIPCCGYLFKENPKKRKLLIDKVPVHFGPTEYNQLKLGQDIKLQDGQVIKSEEVTIPPKKCLSYAYCTDTKYKPDIIPIIENADLLYHETTFLDEMNLRAENTFHSTTTQAATIAQKANVKKLIFGHYSSRYKEIDEFTEEVQAVFPNADFCIEGKSFEITHD